ncbi:long-chain fatty acid--CoA ligase [Micromonospora sonneratiae]|uniref:Class I adenylate-forming enzyme family protein n=1 Tax=Micromonospora sonneratiae TaxID=1184706 RepID=A0ABW3Y5M7_9ACTN
MPSWHLSIASGVREFGLATPDTVAVVDGDLELTYGAVYSRARRLAQDLLGHGLRPGDRVGILLGNRAEYFEIAAGVALAGLVMVPLNPRSTAAEVELIIRHSNARALLLDDTLGDQAATVLAEMAVVRAIGGTTSGPGYEAALAAARDDDPRITVDEHSPFCIAYTSGTTGKPRGVMLSHRSRALTFYASALEWGLGVGRRSLAVAPLYHGGGFAFGYSAVHTGGTVVVQRKWDPEAMLHAVARYGIQSAFMVPTHAQHLRDNSEHLLRTTDLSSLDTLYFNAAALPVPLKHWVLDSFPGVGIHELYGSTEAGVVSDLRPADAARRAGSVGKPWFMTEVRLVDADGNPVARGEAGELYSRSPYVMNGYLDDEAGTRECLTEDGFVSAGDVAIMDDEGFISIVDRKKDMIVSGGVNIYPREIEEILLGHAGVAEVAIAGVPDEQWGESVAAWLVAKPNATLDPAVIETYLRDRIAGYKVPKSWHVLDRLPRNGSGKVLKRELRTMITP